MTKDGIRLGIPLGKRLGELLGVLLGGCVLGGGLWIGAKGVGPVPPLGPLLDPANGIYHVAANAELPRSATAKVPGLFAPVRILYDDRGVPHVFAAREADAQRALGYVVARDRLFQLEAQSRAGAGTLTELVGAAALNEDQRTRALGLDVAAERKLAGLQRYPEELAPITAFAAGVNAYIASLSPRDYPLEYKLLGRAPRPWEPIHAVHLFGRMALTLSYNEAELLHAAAAARFGRAAAEALYPVNSPLQDPIQPSSRPEPRANFHAIPPPGKAEPSPFAVAESRAPSAEPGSDDDLAPILGSNNWAVSPSRTHAGHPILAGDPHLELTLPSIWYEAHLVVPRVLDAYGVTIPGAPSIIIGFNRDVAWSFTNTEADFVDRYIETVDDDARPTRYKVDGAWRPITMRTETYRDRAGKLIATDTVRWSHRGPMRRTNGRWLSMRWTALDSSLSAPLFERVAHARSVPEWMEMMDDYASPPQNMLAADRKGIAIRSTGRYPIRPSGGRGDIVRDGSTSRSDWTGYLPLAKYPRSADPARGFLSSNNQQAVDPADATTYFGSDWPAPWRAIRINELLRTDADVTPDDMRRFQTDPHSARAEFFVPYLLAAANAHPEDSTLSAAARLLGQWDRTYTIDNQRAVLFEFVMRELSTRTWDEMRSRDSVAEPPLPTPDAAVLAELLQQPKSPWWDDHRTPKTVETRDDILRSALAEGFQRTVRELGAPDEGGWRWGRYRHANIMHLLGIRALSALNVPNQGGTGTLNPVSGSGNFGASWRMVVELGPQVQAWGTYPGGQSGNPASSRYMDHVSTWSRGELDTLRFPKSELDLERKLVRSTLVLVPRGK